jgi:hypothetical protein
MMKHRLRSDLWILTGQTREHLTETLSLSLSLSLSFFYFRSSDEASISVVVTGPVLHILLFGASESSRLILLYKIPTKRPMVHCSTENI